MKGFSRVVSCLLTALPFALCLMNTNSLHAQQKDKPGCVDSTYITRFPGSILEGCFDKDDDTQTFEMGAGKPNQTMEGKRNELIYTLPSSASTAQVERNLTTALQTAGWTKVAMDGTTWNKGDVWIALVTGGGRYHVISLKLVPLTQDVVATSEVLGSGIGSTGHAVVPGILFDTAKAELKPESKAALEQVAKLMSQHPDWKLWVVGHTDTVGQVASNMDLSKRRAAAVVQALETQYHIPAARLGSFGNGPYAPVASNDSEDGRTQNRRVEIVKQ